MREYIKPRSVTFWSAISLIVPAIVIATNDVHPLGVWADVVQRLCGDMPPATMFSAGIGLLGLRRAVERG